MCFILFVWLSDIVCLILSPDSKTLSDFAKTLPEIESRESRHGAAEAVIGEVAGDHGDM